MENVHEDIEGLGHDQARMIEGALQLTTAKISEIMTTMEKVQILSGDLVIDQQLINKIKMIGFSRIPISFSNDKRTIFGILLTKSLVGYKFSNQTIKQAIMEEKIDVKVPLFFTDSAGVGEVCKAFKQGQSHMSMVCDSPGSAITLRNFSDKIM